VRVVWGNPEGSRLNLYEVGLDPVTTDSKGKAQFPTLRKTPALTPRSLEREVSAYGASFRRGGVKCLNLTHGM